MKKLFTLTLLFGCWLLAQAAYVIVLPETPTVTEKHAAEFLRKCWGEAGTATDIVSEKDFKADGRFPVFIGKCHSLTDYGIEVNFDALGVEGVRIVKNSKALALAGNRRGVLYCVVTFLQDHQGFRWFTFDCRTIPSALPALPESIDFTYIPPFEYRDTDYQNVNRPEAADFALANRINGVRGHYAAKRYECGYISYSGGFSHTFSRLVPLKEYGETHPEYFSEINGKRVTDRPMQLCLTNPEVLQIITDKTRAMLRANPEFIVSISQDDTGNKSYCQCKNCAAVAKEEGAQSGPLIRFVNAVAEAVCGEFPDCRIDTLAYAYSLEPPQRTKPHPNVIIRFCGTENCYAHPVGDCLNARNIDFRNMLDRWSNISQRLQVWDYVIKFDHYYAPYPTLYTFKPNFKYYLNHHVTGVIESGAWDSRGGELADLRSYIICQLMWNPDCDTGTLIKEFTDAYYGAAAPAVREYIELLHKSYGSGNLHVMQKLSPYCYIDDPDFLTQCEAILDRGAAAVNGDKVLSNRVHLVQLSLAYVRINLRHFDHERRMALVKGFADTLNRNGFRMVKEGERVEKWLADTEQFSLKERPSITVLALKGRAPRIDGNLNDACWQDSPEHALTQHNDIKLQYPMMVKFLHDGKNLYISGTIPDDNRIDTGDVELFFASGSRMKYYRLNLTPKGIKNFGIHAGTWKGNFPGIVQCRKTPGQKGWSFEVQWPLTAMGYQPGLRMRGNVFRHPYPDWRYTNLVPSVQRYHNAEFCADFILEN